jgi:6-phosphogluconolactonase (cycloisomerase 2 family)/phosphohistidine swiveling domain-containing protein
MKNMYKGTLLFGIVAILLLSACDGKDSHTAPISPNNITPTVISHAAQNVSVGENVTLDGSASSDSNGDVLTYRWTLTSKPPTSNAVLAQPNQSSSNFFADVAGAYEATLVVNDGFIDSASTVVLVTAKANVSNTAESPETEQVIPAADAGTTQNVRRNNLVILNGSGSSDANKAILTYQWTLTSKPKKSTATLINATSAKPTFTADLAGTYIASLVINNGDLGSPAATVSINVNATPIASAGSAQKVIPNSLVTLNGGGSSDGNNDPLTYHWLLTSKPTTSAATLKNVMSATPIFTADISGTYTASLIVNDGMENSLPATVTVEADIPVFAFSSNAEESAITTYAVDKKSGFLTNIATTMTGARPISMVVHPSQKYLYVAHMDANSVAVFSINAANGHLTKLSSIPVETTEYSSTVKPAFISGDVEGRFVYVASQVTNNITGSFTTTVSAFSVNQSTGNLARVSSVFPPLNNWSIDTHPNGKTAYIPSYNKNNITTYAIEQSTGALSPIGVAKTGFGPSSVSVEPNGKFAYTSNFKQNTISVFAINQSEGALPLGSLTNTGNTVSVDKGPVFITIHQSGKFLYVGNHDAGNISIFSIDQTSGLLTPINTVVSSLSFLQGISTLTIDPLGKFLYAMTPGSGIWIFSINQMTGDLKEVRREFARSDRQIVFTKVLG